MNTIKPGWEGYITFENMDELLAALKEFLKDKSFTWVTVNQNTGPIPHVTTSLHLDGKQAKISTGSFDDWECYIKIIVRGSTQVVEKCWYVKTHDRTEFSKHHAYFKFYYEFIEIVTSRLGGREIEVISLQ